MTEPIDVVVPNVAEFNTRNPAVSLGPAVTDVVTRLAGHLGDYAAYWSSRPRVLVLPAGHDPHWYADVHDLLNEPVPPVVSPTPVSGMVARDLLGDGAALARLRDLLTGHDEVRLVTWGATPEVFLLAAALRGWGLTVRLDGVPERDYWVSRHLDSKLSCLDLARDVPGVQVPPGLLVVDSTELRGAAEHLLTLHERVIVRSPYGVGGDGSVVLHRDAGGIGALWTAVERDPFLRTFPLLVQQFVAHRQGVGCPAVDLRIDDDGIREIVATAMAVDVSRVRGVHVGPGSVPPAEAERMTHIGRSIGVAAHARGFRGWMCVDFVLADDGSYHVTEINARRSGAMPAIAMLHRWGPAEQVVFSHDAVTLGTRGPLSYLDDVRPVLARLWADGVRIYPTSVRGLGFRQPVLSLMAPGADVAKAQRVVEDAARELAAAVRGGNRVRRQVTATAPSAG
ncbi:preATP grasp domain-containing protein [Micromonospora sp. NPDC003944]